MDDRAKKISKTMRVRKLDNFKIWRDEAKRNGLIKSHYPRLTHNGDLAELIGVVLGDGHIGKHDRCESLRITGTYTNEGFTERYRSMVEKVFGKKPSVAKVTKANACIITIYEKNISIRLGIPSGSRANIIYSLPSWIRKSRAYRIGFLRGLYEAEGTLCHHIPTYTHKLIFKNANRSLLGLVLSEVQALGFHPHASYRMVQVSKREEVQNLADLLQFRRYEM